MKTTRWLTCSLVVAAVLLGLWTALAVFNETGHETHFVDEVISPDGAAVAAIVRDEWRPSTYNSVAVAATGGERDWQLVYETGDVGPCTIWWESATVLRVKCAIWNRETVKPVTRVDSLGVDVHIGP